MSTNIDFLKDKDKHLTIIEQFYIDNLKINDDITILTTTILEKMLEKIQSLDLQKVQPNNLLVMLNKLMLIIEKNNNAKSRLIAVDEVLKYLHGKVK